MNCVNINSNEFKSLLETTGLSSIILEFAIHDYQKALDTDAYPTAKEVFERNPHLQVKPSVSASGNENSNNKPQTKTEKIVESVMNDKLHASKIDMLFARIENAFPGINIIREDNNSTREKGINDVAWFDKDGVHFNTDAVDSRMYMHELTHVLLHMLKHTNPEVYNMLQDKLTEYISNNPQWWSNLKSRYYKKTEDQVREEALAIIAGNVSKARVDTFFGFTRTIPSEKSKSSFIEMIKPFVNMFWEAVTGLFDSFFGGNTFKKDMRYMSLEEIVDSLTRDVLSGNELMNISSRDKEIIAQRLGDSYDGFDTADRIVEVNSVKDIPNILINNENPSVIFSASNDYQKNPGLFADMVYRRRYKSKYGNTVYIEWLGKRFKYENMTESAIKSKIISEVLPFHISAGESFGKNIRTVVEDMKGGTFIDDAIVKVFKRSVENEDGESVRDLNPYISVKQIKRIIELVGANDVIIDVKPLSHFASDPVLSKLYSDSVIGFDPLVIIHKNENNELEISISDIMTGNLGRDDTLTGDNMMLSGRFKSSYESRYSNSKVRWSNSKKDVRAAALTMTIASMNHLAKKNGIKLNIRRAGVYGMKGGITGLVDGRNIFNMKEAFEQVREVMQIPEMKALTKNAFISEVVDNDDAWDATDMTSDHLFELRSYYKSSQVAPDISDDYLTSLIGEGVSREEHIRVLRERQRRIETRLGIDGAMIDYEYIAISQAVLYYNKGTHVNNMTVADISRISKSIVNPHNLGHDIVDYMTIQFEASKSVVVNRANTFSSKMTDLIKASKKSHGTKGTGSDTLFGHLFPTVKAVVNTDNVPKGVKRGDKIDIKLYNQIYCSTHPDTPKMLSSGKLTKEDIELADYIVETVKDLYIRNLMSNNRFKSKYTYDEAIKDFEARYTPGTIPVAPATQEQNIRAFKIGTFFKRFINKMANNDISWGDIMTGEFNDLHSRFERQITISEQYKAMGVEYDEHGFENTNHKIFNYNAISEQSNNLEYTIKMFVLDMERNIEFQKNVVPIYNDCIAITNHIDKNMGSSQLNTQEFIKEYFKFIVHHQRRDDNNNLDTAVRTGLSINSFLSLAYRPVLWVKSAYFNELNSYLASFATDISNMGMSEEERLDLPSSKDITKAHELLFTDYQKVWDLAVKFQLINGNQRDVLENVFSNVADKHMIKYQIAHLGNWYTDAVGRALAMTAYMIKDGSWDAHKHDKKTRTISYDVKSDMRYSNPDGSIKEGWDVVLGVVKDKQGKQGLLDKDGNQTIGYDFEEINKRIKWYSDKFIIGAMDPHQRTMLGNTWGGAALGQFRGFMFDKLWNDFSTKTIKTSYGGKLVPIKDKDGNWITVETQMEMEGVLKSLFAVASELKNIKNRTKWKNMPPMRRRNLVSLMIRSASYALIMGAIKAIDLDDRDERKLTWLFSDIFMFETISSIMKNPVPFATSLEDIWKVVIGEKRVTKLLRFAGPLNDATYLYELLSDTDELFPAKKTKKALKREEKEALMDQERRELEERLSSAVDYNEDYTGTD